MEKIVKLLINKGYKPRFIDYSKNSEDSYLEMALAVKWIRENFGIHIYPQFQTWDGGCWTANWCLKQDILWTFHDIGVMKDSLWHRTKFATPEEATEAALLYTLKHLI